MKRRLGPILKHPAVLAALATAVWFGAELMMSHGLHQHDASMMITALALKYLGFFVGHGR